MKRAIRTAEQLAAMLDLPLEAIDTEQAAAPFRLFVPQPYLSRIRPGDPHDPLLLQVLPVAAENNLPSGFSSDPLQEQSFQQRGGILHKYLGRALMIVNSACAVHCRYCFRRHYPYESSSSAADRWDAAIEYLRSDTTIEEIILSGGDPLTTSDSQLQSLLTALESVEHLQRVRIHTRMPIVIPSRITESLVESLTSRRLQPIVVVHCNHANEIDDEVASSLAKLRGESILLLNQAVLLKGVNDNVDALQSLSERLIEVGVLPYYLHQLDRVAGAAHFEVPMEQGRALVSELRNRLSGYMVPRFVREVAGHPAKQPLEDPADYDTQCEQQQCPG